MKKIILLFSHKLSESQIEKLRVMGVIDMIELPKGLQEKWSNVDPKIENEDVIQEIIGFINKNIEKEDYILVQGEYGMVYAIVDFALKTGIIPIYSATKRICYEKERDDGSKEITHLYRHEEFKEYKKYEIKCHKN